MAWMVFNGGHDEIDIPSFRKVLCTVAFAPYSSFKYSESAASLSLR